MSSIEPFFESGSLQNVVVDSTRVVKCSDWDEIARSSYHARDTSRPVSTQFASEVTEVSLWANPPFALLKDPDASADASYYVFDGMQRIDAAKKGGFSTIPLMVWDIDGIRALAISYEKNTAADCDRHLRPYECQDVLDRLVDEGGYDSQEDAINDLGLESDIARLSRALRDVPDIGDSIVLDLIDEFGSYEMVAAAGVNELMRVDNVGQCNAVNIADALNS